MVSETLYELLDVNIDKYINPYLPHNQFRHLPRPISHFLGYRSEPPKEPPSLIQWALTIFSTVAGICVVGAVFNYAPGIARWNPPTIIASLGATAVLDYNAVRSPLAQPRNSIVGHTLAAIVGVAISRAFMMAPNFFMNYDWVVAAVACAAASIAMSMTGTVHPPGGATAILACADAQIIALGWMLPPLILVASVLMVGVACLFNNTLRQYPTFWWTPEDVGYKLPGRRRKSKAGLDDSDVEKAPSTHTPSSEITLASTRQFYDKVEFIEGIDEVHIRPYRILLPHHIELSDKEIDLLQSLQERIKEHSEVN